MRTKPGHHYGKNKPGDSAGQSGLFVTMLLGFIDPKTRLFSYASAGHPRYYLSRSGESTCSSATGIPLGIKEDATYEVATPLPLQAGYFLLLVTDGLY